MLTPLPFYEVKPGSKAASSNAFCEYHSGTRGHATEQCFQLKDKIREFIRTGAITFPKKPEAGTPNCQQNPLPEHASSGSGVNLILTEEVEEEVDVIDIGGVYLHPEVLYGGFELHLERVAQKLEKSLVLSFPIQKMVQNLNKVPWNYEIVAKTGEGEKFPISIGETDGILGLEWCIRHKI